MNSTERRIRRQVDLSKEDVLEMVEDYPLIALFIATHINCTNDILQEMKNLIKKGKEMRLLLKDVNEKVEKYNILSICKEDGLHNEIKEKIDLQLDQVMVSNDSLESRE